VVEDGGVLLNPMIVDGQILGGIAQGIGTALFEEMPFSDDAQPQASTLADYLLPGPAEMPAVQSPYGAGLALIASTIRRGVTGDTKSSAPSALSASLIALVIAAGGAMAPPSPRLFWPNRVYGDGVSMWMMRTLSRARRDLASALRIAPVRRYAPCGAP